MASFGSPLLTATLTQQHRHLDDLFGRFLAAAQAGEAAAARDAIRDFDEALRRHTASEEQSVLARPASRPCDPPGSLAPAETETTVERLHRELLLEHVQVRELSAMIRHLLEEKSDLEGARRIAPNLARRWDAHTSREEREVFPTWSSDGRE